MAFKWPTIVEGLGTGTKATKAFFEEIKAALTEVEGTATATAPKPVVGANGTITTSSSAGKSRKMISVIVGDGAKTSFVIAHSQGTFAFEATWLSNVAGHPSEVIAAPSAKLVATDENNITVTFSSAPTAGTTYWISICL